MIYDNALIYPRLVLNEARTSANAYNNFDEASGYRLWWEDPTHTTLTKNGNTFTLTYNGNQATPSGFFAVKMKMPQLQRFLTVNVSSTQSTAYVIIYYSNNNDISYSSDYSATWVQGSGFIFDANVGYLPVPFPDYRCRCAIYFSFGRLQAGQSLPKTITITFGTTSAPPSQQNQQLSPAPIGQQEQEEELETELEEPQARLLRDDEFYNAINGQDPVEQQDTKTLTESEFLDALNPTSPIVSQTEKTLLTEKSDWPKELNNNTSPFIEEKPDTNFNFG